MSGWLTKLFSGGRKDACQPASPDEDIAIAERVMAAGELPHAAYHIGAALAVDPNRSDGKALLDRLIMIAPDPLLLAPLTKDNYVGTVAIRAYILAHLNRFNGGDGALSLIAQAALAKPDVPYLDWLIGWLDDPTNLGRCDLKYLSGLVGGGNADEGDRRIATLLADSKAAPFIDRLPRVAVSALPHQTDAYTLSVLTVRVLRQAGFVGLALEVAEAAYRGSPSFFTAISLAATRRALGEWDAALALYEEAYAGKPSEVSTLLDLGDLNWEIGRLADAERWYRAAIALVPDEPWATPSLYGVMVLRSDDDEAEPWRQRLQAYALSNPANGRATWVVRELYTPYFSAYLPEPGEATVNCARQMLDGRAKDEPIAEDLGNAEEEAEVDDAKDAVRIGLSHLEAPSAIRSVRRELRRRGICGVSVEVATIESPDPRKPTASVEFSLWKYDGNDPRPAVPLTVADEVTEAITRIASAPYIFTGWTETACSLGKSLGTSSIPALLSAMVYPPLPSTDTIPMWVWTYRVQIAAALLIAFTEEGWRDASRHRRTLLSLMHGPMDWSVEAALIALVAVARTGPRPHAEIISHIRREMQSLRKHVPRAGYCCWHDTLLLALVNLPGTPREEQNALLAECRLLRQ